MKAKKIVCLLLAFLMVFGTVSWLIALVSSAAPAAPDVLVGYRLDKVYSSKKSAEADKPIYSADPADNLNQYQIRSGYYADFLVSFVLDAKETAPDGLKVSVDSGSFTRVRDISSEPSASPDGSRIVIDLQKLLYSGEGNILGITVYNDAGFEVSERIEISQCVPRVPSTGSDDDDDTDTSSIPDPTPYVIVSSYSYGGAVTAGQEFVLNLSIENTSPIGVGNMTMTITTPDAFTLVNSSNTIYIESLGAHDTYNHSIRMLARASAEPEPAVVNVGFHYQYITGGTRQDVDRSEQIAIPVTQVDRFSIGEFSLPPQIYVGEEFDLEVKYNNKGRSSVYNVEARLEGENLADPNQSETVGNVSSGTNGTMDFFLRSDMPGTLSGKVIITYEDINMNVKTIELPYSVEVMGMEDTGMEGGYADPNLEYYEDGSYMGPDGQIYNPDGTLKEEGPGWVTYAVIAGVILAAIIVLIVVAKKRKAAKLLAELEEDNNEDI